MSTSNAKAAYHHGNLRRALIDTARSLVEETGPDRLTIREVAARIGVSPAAPYRHFASRELLLAAVVAEAFDELTGIIDRQSRSDPLDALHTALTEYVRFALATPHLYRLMFGAGRPDRAEHPDVFAAQQRLGTAATEALQRAAAAGAIATTDLDDVLLTLRSLMHGVATWALDAGLSPAEAMAGVRGVLTVLNRGLLPR